MNTQQKHGLFLVGKLAGYRQVDGISKSTQQPYTLHYLGLELPKDDGYSGSTEIVDVQLSRKAIDAGIIGKIQENKDKTVQLEVYVRAYVGKGGAGYNFNLTNDKDAIVPLVSTNSKVA